VKHDKLVNPSRQMLIKQSVAVAATALAAGTLLRPRTVQAAKAAKSSMMYQDKPHANQRCSGCVQFVPGSSPDANGTCRVVAGSISPNGWCVAFTPKS